MMKRHLAILTLVILALAISVPVAWSQGGNAEQQIKTLSDQISAAMLKGDASFLEKVYADDYTGIRGDGSVLTKAQEVELFKSNAFKYEALKVQDWKVRVYGNTAVTTSLSFSKNVRNGKPFSGDTRNTRVWVKQKGDWKCVAYQTTRVSQ
jgi:ketosteroid isomerase-like protein